MSDRYKGGTLLRRWSLIGGYPRCVLPPLVLTEATAAEIAAVEAENARIHAAVAAAEACEAGAGEVTPETLALAARRAAGAPGEPIVLALVDAAGRVVDVLAVDPDWTPPAGLQAVPVGDGARVGGTYADGVFTPPAPPPGPVPEEVSLFQGRAALLAAGLLAATDSAVQAAGPLAVQAWEYATVFDRRSALVQQLAGELGLNSAEIDDLFRQAAAVTA